MSRKGDRERCSQDEMHMAISVFGCRKPLVDNEWLFFSSFEQMDMLLLHFISGAEDSFHSRPVESLIEIVLIGASLSEPHTSGTIH